VVRLDERHDPPGLAAVHSRHPSRHHGAFIIPIVGENRSQGAVIRPTPAATSASKIFLLDVCSDFVLKSIPNRFRDAGPQSVAGLL
jgi:hypothetical protein